MLSIQMNDAAARMLGVHDGLLPVPPPGGLAAGLEEVLTRGIVRRERVLTWSGSTGGAAGAPSFFPDLTAWECSDSFGIRFTRLVRDLDEPRPVRCIIGANDTNATFRFHQIRRGESWNHADLDSYQLDKLIVIDIAPFVR
jgi:hypothetical protein